MRPEIHHLEDFEARSRDVVKDARDVRHLAAGEYELVDKLTAGRALRLPVAVGGSDAVIEGEAAGPQQSRDLK